jgi:hypothetical protein
VRSTESSGEKIPSAATLSPRLSLVTTSASSPPHPTWSSGYAVGEGGQKRTTTGGTRAATRGTRLGKVDRTQSAGGDRRDAGNGDRP